MKKYYAVVRGHNPGIYDTWDDAKEQIKGFSNSYFNVFNTFEKAYQWFKRQPYPGLPTLSIDSPTPPQKQHDIHIYCDGNRLENTGRGGYSVITLQDDNKHTYSKGFKKTTTTRMELMACIAGLENLQKNSNVGIYTNSLYVINSMNIGWAYNWMNNGWKKSDGKQVENIDLWYQLLMLCDNHHVSFYFVKGKIGRKYNKECCKMSRNAASRSELSVDRGFKDTQK